MQFSGLVDFGKSELCKKCAHTKVCFKDKNLFGDLFVAGNPMIFDNKKLYEKFKERENRGFPCDDFLSIEERKVGKWIDPAAINVYRCSVCEESTTLEVPGLFYHYCPNCGAEMKGDL